MIELQNVIESYNTYIKNVSSGVIYIANCLREDNLNDALYSIKDFTEGVLWLSQACALMKKNGVNVEMNIEQIQEFLVEINEGLEKQDYVLVADMFEYEIAPFFEELELAEEPVQ